jgi:hypothetical protein
MWGLRVAEIFEDHGLAAVADDDQLTGVDFALVH